MAPVDRLQVRGGPARSTLGEVPGPRQTHLTVFFTPQVSFLELDKGAHKKRTLVVAQFYFLEKKHKHKTSCAALVVFAQYSYLQPN